jgi:uridylate kinase
MRRPTAAARAGLKYPRVLLKISGEALAGEQGFGIARRSSTS